MSPDRERRRPMQLHREPEQPPEGTRTVIFRLVSGPDIVVTPTADQVEVFLDELRATWRHEVFNSFTFSKPDGSQTLLNPAHIVAVDVR